MGVPKNYAFEWSEEKSGRVSMAADVSFGADPTGAKKVIAHLVPNTERQYKGWYVTDIQHDIPDWGHSAVDVRNLEEGKAFLEKWANERAMPELERREAMRKRLNERLNERLRDKGREKGRTRGDGRER